MQKKILWISLALLLTSKLQMNAQNAQYAKNRQPLQTVVCWQHPVLTR
jgi:hypothetical protein